MIGEARLKLSALWGSLMLTYLLGDVLRIFSGDFVAGQVGGMEVSQGLYLALAILLVIPVVMVFLSLTLPYKVNRWANIILPIFFFIFNVIGLPTYPALYDRFLIVVGLLFNALTVWHAFRWVEQETVATRPASR
jgi:predicted ferric reductase